MNGWSFDGDGAARQREKVLGVHVSESEDDLAVENILAALWLSKECRKLEMAGPGVNERVSVGGISILGHADWRRCREADRKFRL